MSALSDLRAQQAAIEAQIQEEEARLARSGETVTIDGVTITDTYDIEGNLPDSTETDFFITYRKDAESDVSAIGEISYKNLVDKFAQEAEQKKQEAITAGTEAVSAIDQTKQAALDSIGHEKPLLML